MVEGGFLHITAGSDVSLGIDSWLDDMSSPCGFCWPGIWMEVECVLSAITYYYPTLL